MSRILLKTSPDEDLYCIWSSVVEAPVWMGTRSQLRVELLAEAQYLHGGGFRTDDELELVTSQVDARLANADEYGSSSRMEGEWHEDDDMRSILIYKQKGTLPRSKLGAFLRSFNESAAPDTEEFDVTMLEPFDG